MVSHEELATIRGRMKELDSQNQSAFIRRYAVNIDFSPIRELISLQRHCVNNLAQIAKHAQAHNSYQAVIMELQ